MKRVETRGSYWIEANKRREGAIQHDNVVDAIHNFCRGYDDAEMLSRRDVDQIMRDLVESARPL